MKNFTQLNIVLSLVIASCFCLTIRASQAASPGSSAGKEVAFLKAIPKQATLAQIKKLLPRGTKFSAPHWDQLYGNRITVKGKISGWLWFISKRRQQKSDDYTSDKEKFRTSDWINHVQLVMDNGKISSLKDEEARIKAVRKILGKPVEYSYHSDDGSSDSVGNGYQLPGWYAEWKISNQRSVSCFPNRGINGKKASILTLNIPNHWQGAG